MRILKGLIILTFVAGSVFSQEKPADGSSVDWVKGPAKENLSTVSSLQIPEGYAFTGPQGTKTMMRLMGNIVSDSEIGMVTSSNGWIAVFEFDPIGYVKDDEKDALDADALMKTFKTNEISSNKYRLENGLRELEIVDWFKKPFYNEKTQNLEWCTTLRSKGSTDLFANHNIRILGRRGVTRITLVADIDRLETAIPELAAVLEGYEYQAGGKYAEYRKGDQIAKYGLTALVAGGAAAVALKSGLLKPVLKFLVIGAAAAAGFFRKFFKRGK